MNIFEKELNTTESGNGSVKVISTDNIFVDDFGNISRYKEKRDFDEIFKTISSLWKEDSLMALKELVYIRLITRNPIRFSGEKMSVHRGQGLRHEYIVRLYWIAVKFPKIFEKNIEIFLIAGGWRDIIALLRCDLENGSTRYRLNWGFILNLIKLGLLDKNQSNLVKKWLPQIKANSKCKNDNTFRNNFIAKTIAKYLFRSDCFKRYRLLKSSGTAHEWQKLISQGKFNEIDFSKIAGRALNLLTNSKFIENHHLETKFINWIDSQDSVKFTGFPYELFKNTVPYNYQKEVINKQFMNLINVASQDMNRDSKFIVCLDSSGSMTSNAVGTNITSLNIARSMALYFSYLLEGEFSKTFLEFNRCVTIQKWHGDTPYENMFSTPLSGWCGNTDFLAIADLFVKLRNKYSEKDFPTGVLCISDGEFDRGNDNKSTFELFKIRLEKGGFSKEFVDNFKLVLWDIPNGWYGRSKTVFESTAEHPNFFYMSGFDPSGIAFLTGKEIKDKPTPKNALELFQAAMDQDLLNLLKL